jgi:gas vesicle protein
MSRETERAASNLVCFMLGAALGAAVALLYAPQEGKETRRILGEKAEEARDKVSKAAETVKESAQERYEAVSEKVQGLRRMHTSPIELDEEEAEA